MTNAGTAVRRTAEIGTQLGIDAPRRTSIPTRSSNRCVPGPYVHESKELLLLQLEPLSQLDELHDPLSKDPNVWVVSTPAVIDDDSAAIWNGVAVEHAEKS
jgi:hypothetical protein